METETITALALKADWLNTSGACDTFSGINGLANTTALNISGMACNGWYPSTYWYPWTYPVYVNSPSRPIKLTLAEVDKLRKAAKTDAALRAVLEKFTSQIEVLVEFA